MQGELDLRVEDGSLLLASSGGVQGRHVLCPALPHCPLGSGLSGLGGDRLCVDSYVLPICVWEAVSGGRGESEWGGLRNKCSR